MTGLLDILKETDLRVHLAECLSERTAPELLYLQTKWASLMS